MRPVLFELQLGEHTAAVQSYPVLALLAACLVLSLSYIIALERGLPRLTSLACLFIMAAAFPAGARLAHIAFNLPLYLDSTYHFLGMRGFSLSGGLLGAAVAGLISCHFWQLDRWRLADATAPALGAGIAVMRIGCFLNGCCYGQATALPWGVTFPPEITSAALPVHPVQLYEAAAALAGTALAAWLLHRGAAHGSAFLAFSLWFACSHWLIAFLGTPSPSAGLPSIFCTIVYAALCITAAALLYSRRKTF